MNTNIVKEAKEFVAQLRNDLRGMVDDDNLFIVSVQGTGEVATNISVALYDDMKVGSLARERLPGMYNAGDKLLSCASNLYNGITSVVILLTDEYQTEVFQEGKVLNITNLDA